MADPLSSSYPRAGQDGVEIDKPRALALAGESCLLGVAAACVNASRMCREADGVPRDDSKARGYANMARQLYDLENGQGQ